MDVSNIKRIAIQIFRISVVAVCMWWASSSAQPALVVKPVTAGVTTEDIQNILAKPQSSCVVDVENNGPVMNIAFVCSGYGMAAMVFFSRCLDAAKTGPKVIEDGPGRVTYSVISCEIPLD